jgi:HAD superfamily hydrolase (TIGR01509 family)
MRRVRKQGEVLGIGSNEGRQPRASLVHGRLQVAGEERDGLALHARAPFVLCGQHDARGRAVGAVVEEDGARVERPVAGELGWHRAGIVRPMASVRRPEAILFDLDGTLVDTVPARIDAWASVFDEVGISSTRAQLEPMIGIDGRRLAREAAQAAGHDLTDEEAEAIDRRSGELFDERNGDPRPLPGARELLRTLDGRELTWAIATSSRREQVAASIGALGLDREPRIVDGSHVQHAKPAPDLLLLGARELGVRADRCWYVGDSTWDMRAAVAAGMEPIGVLAGAVVDERALSESGATLVLGTLAELELPA